MTEGSIPRLLITFALPLMVGNVFQQLYNTVDSYHLCAAADGGQRVPAALQHG